MFPGLDLIMVYNSSNLVEVRLESQLPNDRLFPIPYGVPLKAARSQLASDISKWEQSASEVRELGLLEENWDGYGGLKINSRVVDNTVRALEMMAAANPVIVVPEISPTSSGTIALRWDTSEMEAVIEFGITRFSGYVQARHQPTVYLGGDATKFSYEDFASLASAAQNAVAPAVYTFEVADLLDAERLAA